jgi:hypothetical protein
VPEIALFGSDPKPLLVYHQGVVVIMFIACAVCDSLAPHPPYPAVDHLYLPGDRHCLPGVSKKHKREEVVCQPGVSTKKGRTRKPARLVTPPPSRP